MSHMSNCLEIVHLSVSYQGKSVLSDLSLQIEPGKITGIIGPNGAGKSSFLKGIMGLIKTDQRDVRFGGTKLDAQKKRIAYVEQRSSLDLSFPISVLEVVLLGTYPKLGLFRRPGKKEKELAITALQTVQLTEFANKQIGELSGGQLQRVFLARVLAQEPDMIILDEPFVGIDMTSEQVIMSVLKQLKTSGKTVIIVHHDLHKVTHYFDNLIVLNKQLITQGPVATTFSSHTIQLAYGDHLANSYIEGVVPT